MMITSWYFGEPSFNQDDQELEESLTVASSEGCVGWFEQQTELNTNMTAEDLSSIRGRWAVFTQQTIQKKFQKNEKVYMLVFVRLGALQDGNMFCASSERGVREVSKTPVTENFR